MLKENQSALYVWYCLYWHPLAKYPGPFVAKVTNAYGGYFAYIKKTHLQILANSGKYGTIDSLRLFVSTDLFTQVPSFDRDLTGWSSIL